MWLIAYRDQLEAKGRAAKFVNRFVAGELRTFRWVVGSLSTVGDYVASSRNLHRRARVIPPHYRRISSWRRRNNEERRTWPYSFGHHRVWRTVECELGFSRYSHRLGEHPEQTSHSAAQSSSIRRA